jgi:hypothetical protein
MPLCNVLSPLFDLQGQLQAAGASQDGRPSSSDAAASNVVPSGAAGLGCLGQAWEMQPQAWEVEPLAPAAAPAAAECVFQSPMLAARHAQQGMLQRLTDLHWLGGSQGCTAAGAEVRGCKQWTQAAADQPGVLFCFLCSE